MSFETAGYQLAPVLPELVLAVGAMALLMLGAFRGQGTTKTVTSLAVVLLMYMIREGEVVKVTSYFYLVPPVTLIQTWLLFDERLNAAALVGCALTVYAVYKVVRTLTTSA